MEQSPNPKEEEEGLKGKLHELLDESDDEGECGQFRFQEETVEEVMQELYKEIAFPLLSQTVPSSVFVNDGKNGSCGASVSDTASTVMAGIEVASPGGCGFPVTGNVSAAVEVVEEEKKIEGFDLDDDEWIGRVLCWSQQNHVQVVEDRQWF